MRQRLQSANVLLLCAAWICGLLVFSPALEGGWICDDYDYVLNDPRLNHLSLFLPGHWSDPPPALNNLPDGAPFLPAYQSPMTSDRFLWRLSFALERRIAGLSPTNAHAVNLLLHLGCIAALYWALGSLVALYFGDGNALGADRAEWQLLPGIAALIFAVHPWVAEPVCYISARNASLGTLFVLLGTAFWAGALLQNGSRVGQAAKYCAAGVCAMAAFASKENFITAVAGYFLVSLPVLCQRRAGQWKKTLPVVATALLISFGVAYLGIQYSERAAGLWAQAYDRGFGYLFRIQSPLVLQALCDQLLVLRLSFETNDPNWPVWACELALSANAAIVIISLVAGFRWRVLLGVTWFYLHLLPTNSFLPRPDFLAARNLYLPVAGIATLCAGGLLSAWHWCGAANLIEIKNLLRGRARMVTVLSVLLFLYWAVSAHNWSNAFVESKQLFARSAKMAPDHAPTHLNLACAILNEVPSSGKKTEQLRDAEREVRLALAAENSSTMQYYTERPRRILHALALRLLAQISFAKGDGRNALHLYRESWTLNPSLPAWTGWVLVALDNNYAQETMDAAQQGEQHWPDAWWPIAARGLYRSMKVSDPHKIPADALEDLEMAEHAPDAALPELRSLQRCSLYQLAQADAVRPRAKQVFERLVRLGLSSEDQAHLMSLLQSNSGNINREERI
jgi:hypothetical protein